MFDVIMVLYDKLKMCELIGIYMLFLIVFNLKMKLVCMVMMV